MLTMTLMTGTAMADTLDKLNHSAYEESSSDEGKAPETPVDGSPAEAETKETAVPENNDSCKAKGQAFDIDLGICVDGVAFCKQSNIGKDAPKGFEYAWDNENRLCYLNNTDTNIGQFSILPYTDYSVAECESLFSQDALSGGTLLKKFLSGESGDSAPRLEKQASPSDGSSKSTPEEVSKLDVLGCGIKTGRMKLWMIPYYIKSLVRFALSIAGLVAVGAMVIGGYFYMFGTLMDDKERGKRSIIYGLAGFVVVLLAWAIVNVVISIATM